MRVRLPPRYPCRKLQNSRYCCSRHAQEGSPQQHHHICLVNLHQIISSRLDELSLLCLDLFSMDLVKTVDSFHCKFNLPPPSIYTSVTTPCCSPHHASVIPSLLSLPATQKVSAAPSIECSHRVDDHTTASTWLLRYLGWGLLLDGSSPSWLIRSHRIKKACNGSERGPRPSRSTAARRVLDACGRDYSWGMVHAEDRLIGDGGIARLVMVGLGAPSLGLALC
jgi:hypothetical protein